MNRVAFFLLFLSTNAMAAFTITDKEIIPTDDGTAIQCVRFTIAVDNHGQFTIPICTPEHVIFNYNAQGDFTAQTKLDIRNALRNELLQIRAAKIAEKNAEDLLNAQKDARRQKINLPIDDGDIN